jgi:hypothetical protein
MIKKKHNKEKKEIRKTLTLIIKKFSEDIFSPFKKKVSFDKIKKELEKTEIKQAIDNKNIKEELNITTVEEEKSDYHIDIDKKEAAAVNDIKYEEERPIDLNYEEAIEVVNQQETEPFRKLDTPIPEWYEIYPDKIKKKEEGKVEEEIKYLQADILQRMEMDAEASKQEIRKRMKDNGYNYNNM